MMADTRRQRKTRQKLTTKEPVSRKEAAASLMVRIQSVTCAAENCILSRKPPEKDENPEQLVFNEIACVRFGARLRLTTLPYELRYEDTVICCILLFSKHRDILRCYIINSDIEIIV